ncbi:MAG: hypothetical protein AAF236_16755, partial [Verrucomicrobiota bacterium]
AGERRTENGERRTESGNDAVTRPHTLFLRTFILSHIRTDPRVRRTAPFTFYCGHAAYTFAPSPTDEDEDEDEASGRLKSV